MTITHRITTTAAVLLSFVAAGAPTAAGRPIDDHGHPDATTVYSQPDKSIIAVSSSPSAAIVAKPNVPQAVVRVQTPPSGFDWGDAGIGAAGGLTLAMLGLGGVLVVSQRRGRTRHHTA
jgi:hypothetical protein